MQSGSEALGGSLYSLSETDFRRIPPVTPLPFRQEEVIARDNFASFLISGFSTSRGRPAAHSTYFKWLEINQGFDYQSTLTNFLSAGGWNILSDPEKANITTAVRRVGKHEKVRVEDERTRKKKIIDLRKLDDDRIGEMVISQIESALRHVSSDNPPVEPVDLKGMPYGVLVSRIAEWIERSPNWTTDYALETWAPEY